MFARHLVITVGVTVGLILACALAVAFARHDLGVQSVIEYVWGISFAFTALGYLLRSGATMGDTPERTEGVRRTSQNLKGYAQADQDDATVGFAFGTVVMLSSLAVFAVSFAVLYAFFRK